MTKKKEIKNSITKCKHDECQRLADPKDNKMGYCKECIQLNSKACNCCGTDTTEQPKKHAFSLRTLMYIILTCAGLAILFALATAIISDNGQAIAGWFSALIWFVGFIVMRRTADSYLDIAMMAIEDVKRLERKK